MKYMFSTEKFYRLNPNIKVPQPWVDDCDGCIIEHTHPTISMQVPINGVPTWTKGFVDVHGRSGLTWVIPCIYCVQVIDKHRQVRRLPK